MDQVATLTTGWEPDTPLDDSVLRQFVFAYADRRQLGFLDLVRLTI